MSARSCRSLTADADMLRFTKAHAYGNDFLYVDKAAVRHLSPAPLAQAMCDRHTGIGADGLISTRPPPMARRCRCGTRTAARPKCPATASAAWPRLLLRDDDRETAAVTVHTAAGDKRLTRIGRSGARQTFRTAMGPPADVRQVSLMAGGETLRAVVLNMGNPQCVLLGPLPDDDRFRRHRRRARAPHDVCRRHQRRVRRGRSARSRADPDLGARLRAHPVVGNRFVRGGGRGGVVRRRGPRRWRSSRPAGRSGSSGSRTASTSPAGSK